MALTQTKPFKFTKLFFTLSVFLLITRPGLSDPIAIPALPAQAQAQFAALPQAAQKFAQEQLARMGRFDPAHTLLDKTGHFFLVEDAVKAQAAFEEAPPALTTLSDTPITTFTPEGVPLFHSLPGGPIILYINFLGGAITGTAWNDMYGSAVFDALPYDVDGVPGFSPDEQAAMANIWRRMAEDYSPWQVDVTTERVPTMSNVAVAMITKHVTATGAPMPSSYAGGVAYLDTVGYYDAAYYSPAFVYWDNLINGREDVVAEAASHEIGHNFGLTHDGHVNGSPYYGGSGIGSRSWGPLMGAPYFRAITKFNNGDYPGANNQEDDVEIITSRVALRVDDVGNTTTDASPLTKSGGTFSRSAIASWYSDVDMFSLDGVTAVSVTAKPYVGNFGSGNNVDLAVELLDAAGNRLMVSNPDDSSAASLSATNLVAGKYFIKVYPVGNPVTPYSVYGSMGEFDVIGTYVDAPPPPPPPTGTVLYEASMATFPTGWTVNRPGLWSYGRPSSAPDPKGANVVGNVLNGSGLYPEKLSGSDQLITKSFSTVGIASATLQFDRFLGIYRGDVATIHACDPSGCWLLWTNGFTGGFTVIDPTWKTITLSLPKSKMGQPRVQIRFGLGPIYAPNSSFGWNIKNLVITGKN